MVRHACFRNLSLAEKKASAHNLISLGDVLLAKSAAGVTQMGCVGFAQGKTMSKI